jgi:hypothetical protein
MARQNSEKRRNQFLGEVEAFLSRKPDESIGSLGQQRPDKRPASTGSPRRNPGVAQTPRSASKSKYAGMRS